MSPLDCIPEPQLRFFLDGKLPPQAAQSVEAHLRGCARCREVAERLRRPMSPHPPEEKLAGGSTDSMPPEVTEDYHYDPKLPLELLEQSELAESLGRIKDYEVLGVLGRGGYGIVFEALDKVLNRRVAIKVLPKELATLDSSRRRFLREARAGAAINHPNVVTIYGVDETKDFPFLVMELLRGKSLRERLRREPKMAPMDIVRVSAQIAQGLAAAHAQGIIHRDVKPGNIMLVDDLPRIKITDFGLARAIVENFDLTSRGMAVGTPGYMSPEQVRGEELDARSDLFALGCVIYSMFTGHSPFHGRTMLDIARRVDAYDPPPLREIDKAVPEFMDTLVARLLKKKPEERFQSAAEVADVLNRHLALLNQTPTDRLPAALRMDLLDSRPLTRRWPLLVTGLATVALVVAAGIAYWRLGQSGWPFAATALSYQDNGLPSEPPTAAGSPSRDSMPASAAVSGVAAAGKSVPSTPVVRRDHVSVAKSGVADCRSIRDALEQVAAGGTIRILDGEEYEEALLLDDSKHLAGVQLLAPEHARLRFPQSGTLIAVQAIPHLQISGLVLLVPQGQMGIEVRGDCPGLRLDGVTVQRLPNAETVRDSNGAIIVRGAGSSEHPIVIHHATLLDTNVGIVIGTATSDAPRVQHVLVEDCLVRGMNAEESTLLAFVRRCQDVVIRRCIIHQGQRGLSFLTDADAHPDRCLLEHNTWYQTATWIESFGPVPAEFSLQVQHSLVVGPAQVSPAARALLAGTSRTFTNNLVVPSGAGNPGPLAPADLAPFALAMDNFPLMSLDPKNPDFLKPDWDRLAARPIPLDPVPGAFPPPR